MARFTVFLDACVLVPIAPCDTLLRMADAGAFRPLWSKRVTDEALCALEPLGLEAIRVDDFLLDQFDLSPTAACRIVSEQSAAMANPPVATEELLTRIAKGGAPGFARAVREWLANEVLSAESETES